jgi:hypothetical protein
VKGLLGHSDIKTTMRYAHSNDDAKRQAVERLNGTGDHADATSSEKTGTVVPMKKKVAV